MDQNAERGSPREAARIHELKTEVAGALGRKAGDVVVGNFNRESRFLTGFTSSTEKRPGFFKMSSDNPNPEEAKRSKDQIAKESSGTTLAGELGIPSVKVLTNYKETANGKGILELEQLNAENGTFISAELVESADSKYGRMAALSLMAASGKEIPPHITAQGVNDGDWRNKSLETFQAVWGDSDTIFDPKHSGTLSQVVNPQSLKQVADTTLSALQEEIPLHDTPDKRFFVHNDAAPNNMFFEEPTAGSEGRTLLLDLEHSGYTTNKFLAQITDLGNFYGRSWANKDMQQTFIKGILEAPPEDTQDTPEHRYKLAKAAIVFGTLYLAKYGMDPTHPEHPMTRKLLGNLGNNLTFLDTTYQALKAA